MKQNLVGISREAIRGAQASTNDKSFQQAIVQARVLAGLMVPALKQVTGYNQQPRIYTHTSPITETVAAAGEQYRRTINFTANADFLWTWLNVIAGANGQSAHTYDLQVVFGGNDRNLVNRSNGIPAEAIANSERDGWMLPKAFVLRKNTTINITLTTKDSTDLTQVYVMLGGIDYFDANVIDATRQTY